MNVNRSAWRHRLLPMLQLVLGVCIVVALIIERRLDDRLRVTTDASVEYRLSIELVTQIRRDVRKRYVAVLEDGVSELAPFDPQQQTRAEKIAALSANARAFGECATCLEHRARQTLSDEVAAFCASLIEAGPADYAKLKRHVASSDGLVELILAANSSAASANDAEISRMRSLQNDSRLIGATLLLALLSLFVTWRIRVAARAKIEASERNDREQKALNEALEARVTERTRELAGANQSLAAEMEARLRAEIDLRHAQKLEAVGRLASGIAHEINTPVQFVGDSVQFVKTGFGDLFALIDAYRAFVEAADAAQSRVVVNEAEETADLPYLRENLPKAVERSVDGLHRVATLVRAMKQFAHPGQNTSSPADLNLALQNTLVIAANEYKYVADIETDYGILSPVLCRIDELNQTFLNIIVNAAHAIGDVVAASGQRGRITVGTRTEANDVVVTISDTGGGIPPEIFEKIFDPFFTTKEVGKGTGQGLTIARSVVEKHGGALTFTSIVGQGTTFSIRLPVAGVESESSK